MAEVKISTKGKPLLYHEGHVYNKFQSRLDGRVTSWRCVKRCGGWVTQCENEYVPSKKHSCDPSPTGIEVRQLKQRIRERAISHPYEKPSNTLSEVKRNASLHIIPHLPDDASLKSTINRQRREHQKYRVTGKTRQALTFPMELLVTNRNETFLAYDSRDEDRILIFSTAQNLLELGLSSVWLCDGTFKVAPDLYTQVFSVHGFVDGWILPLAFGLLPDKKQVTYEKFFHNLRLVSKGNISTPEIVITDFEMAEIGAVHKVFETTSIQGCFFHFSQSLHRNLPKDVIGKIRDGEKDLELLVKKFAAHAFLPPNHVDIVFSEFKKIVLAAYPCIAAFAAYFQENYVGNSIQGPRFSVNVWNVYHRVIANIPRTNNAIEGYNHRLNSKVNAAHPGMERLLEIFKDEQSRVEECFVLYQAGGEPPKKVEKYAKLNARLVKLVNSYEYSSRMDYLTGVAFNLMGIKSIKKSQPIDASAQ